MKKRSLLVLTLIMALSLSACGGSKLVEVELPSMVARQAFGDIDKEGAKALIDKEHGIEEVELKDDGSLVFKMTKEGHEGLVKEMDDQLQAMIEEIKTSGEIDFVKDIIYNKGYKEVKIVVDEEGYNANPEMGMMLAGGIGGGAGSYQSYAKEELGSVIIIENEAGKELSRINYPDDLKEILGL